MDSTFPVCVGTKNSFSNKAREETNEIKERNEGKEPGRQVKSDTTQRKFHLELLAMPNFMK